MSNAVLLCSLLVLSFVIVSISSVDLICPGYGFLSAPANCTSDCTSEDDQCPTGTKCCYRPVKPCGFHCVRSKLDVKKPGQCPESFAPADSSMWFLCDGHDCDVDKDCSGTHKCCVNACGSKVCFPPK